MGQKGPSAPSPRRALAGLRHTATSQSLEPFRGGAAPPARNSPQQRGCRTRALFALPDKRPRTAESRRAAPKLPALTRGRGRHTASSPFPRPLPSPERRSPARPLTARDGAPAQPSLARRRLTAAPRPPLLREAGVPPAQRGAPWRHGGAAADRGPRAATRGVPLRGERRSAAAGAERSDAVFYCREFLPRVSVNSHYTVRR